MTMRNVALPFADFWLDHPLPPLFNAVHLFSFQLLLVTLTYLRRMYDHKHWCEYCLEPLAPDEGWAAKE